VAQERPKVFGIGFHKTATSSLGEALQILGYRVASVVGIRDQDIADTYKEKAFALVQDFDAFEDNPWPLLYRELDRAFPGSKFILTRRPDEAWLKSATRHFGGQSTPMRELIYDGHGDPEGYEELYLARYRKHNDDVLSYFVDRPHDLLQMDITAGDAWDTLCPFLGQPTPNKSFPAANRAEDRDKIPGIFSKLRRIFGS
jgi:hypothetical protein